MNARNELLLTEEVAPRRISRLERVYIGASTILNLGSTGVGGVAVVRGFETNNMPLSALGVCVALWNGKTLFDIAEYLEEVKSRETD